MSTLPAKILKEALVNTNLTIEDLRNFLPKGQEVAKDQFDAFCKGYSPEESSSPFAIPDFRIQHLLVKNFRKFGDLPDKEYYGLNLTVDTTGSCDKLLDFITLLGDNGVGKSSLVDSLEYMFTGKIGEAKVRHIHPGQYIINKSGERDVLVYLNNDEKYNLDDERLTIFRKEYDVTNFFFSENSILKFAEFTKRNGDGASNWFPFFCYILGLGALYDACEPKGILDIIKEQVELAKQLIISDDVQKLHNDLAILLRDGSFKIGKKQKVYLTRLNNKMSRIIERMQTDSHFTLADEIPNIFCKSDFSYENLFYFIKDFHSIFQDLVSQQQASQQPTLFQGLKRVFDLDSSRKSKSKDTLINAMTDCLKHIRIVLENGKGIPPFEKIKQDMKTLLDKEEASSLVESEKTAEDLERILMGLDLLRENLKKLIHDKIVEYIDEKFVEVVNKIFDKTFVTEEERSLGFDISKLATENTVRINIKEEPVHKYFNTFRYRLFCLTLQAVLNIKVMKNENFSFPFVMDDVFYANDYKNKRELYRYFEQIIDFAAQKLTSEGQGLQILFFTHDEQIVSCFSSTHWVGNSSLVRLLQPTFVSKYSFNQITLQNCDEKYYNLYFQLYEGMV